MDGLLTGFPLEIFDLILDKLPKADIHALSQVSKLLRGAVAKTLWQSVIIRPMSVGDLPYLPKTTGMPEACLKLAKDLHFRSSVTNRFATHNPCPHAKLLEDVASELSSDWENDEPDAFEEFGQKAKEILQRLAENQLRSFSWDYGTCVPPEVLGADGIINRTQPLLRSLSLTTAATCLNDKALDLSSLHHLQSLRWVAVHAAQIDALSVAIKLNKAHLQSLELDFLHWPQFRDDIDEGRYVDSDSREIDLLDLHFFPKHILGLRISNNPPSILFPQIRVLSLTQIPILPLVAHAINFDTLSSLTLRMCPLWEEFIQTVLELRVPIRLTRLEIQADVNAEHSGAYSIIEDFLASFSGLNELFLGQAGRVATLKLWNTIARCHPTLKRFVHHQRTIDPDDPEGSFSYDDRDHLGVRGSDLRKMRKYPLRKNPLARLNLECIGLCCLPQRLKYILRPYRTNNSMTVLHIRQSAPFLIFYQSWFIRDGSSEDEEEDDEEPEEQHDSSSISSNGDSISSRSLNVDRRAVLNNEDENEEYSDGDEDKEGEDEWIDEDDWVDEDEYEDEQEGPRLTQNFSRVAKWAFGPHGIPSLQVIAVGDYAPGGTDDWNNHFFCRDTGKSKQFRHLPMSEQLAKEVWEEYGHVLEACSVEKLPLNAMASPRGF